MVAVGGYARREMSIHSDVDLLCLYRDHVTPYVKAVAERLQTWLWDAQVTLGGASRTLADTIELARGDTTVCTSLLAPRFLAGSGMLFHQFTRMVQDRAARPARGVHRRARSRRPTQRHTRYGDSLYLLQPNVKEGAGGLRDYHAAWWAMQAALPGARSRSDLLHQGLLTDQEMAGMLAALDFLWRVRNELHLLRGPQARPDELRPPGAHRRRRSATSRRAARACPSSASCATTTATRATCSTPRRS